MPASPCRTLMVDALSRFCFDCRLHCRGDLRRRTARPSSNCQGRPLYPAERREMDEQTQVCLMPPDHVHALERAREEKTDGEVDQMGCAEDRGNFTTIDLGTSCSIPRPRTAAGAGCSAKKAMRSVGDWRSSGCPTLREIAGKERYNDGESNSISNYWGTSWAVIGLNAAAD